MKILISSKHILLLLFLTFLSCARSTDNLISDYVNEFNSESKKTIVDQQNLQSMFAEKTGDKEITITIVSNSIITGFEKDLLLGYINEVFTLFIYEIKNGNKLLELGVNFKMKFYSSDNQLISEKIFNSSNINKIDIDGDKYENIKSLINISNKNLPIIDSTSGIAITKIELSDDKSLIYYAEIPDDLIEAIKSQEAKKKVKEEILRDKEINKIFNSFSLNELKDIKYVYKDKNGNTLITLEINRSDLLK